MNKRIEELAVQAGFKYIKEEGIGWAGNYNSSLDKFAELVAAAEREACAAFLESGVDLAGLAGDRMMQAFIGKLLIGCAAAIRARGE